MTVLRDYIREELYYSGETVIYPPHIFERSYVTGVLGIPLALNESSPYSRAIEEQIIREHLIFEGFFADAKELGGNLKKSAVALRYIAEDPARIKTFVQAVYATQIKGPVKKIIEFAESILEFVVEKGKEYGIKFIDKIQSFFEKLVKRLKDTWAAIKGLEGWKAAIAVLGFAAGVTYILNGQEDIMDQIEEWLGDLKDLAKKAKKGSEKIAKKAKKVAKAEALAPALSSLILTKAEDDMLNEFLGGIFGKKNKDADEMGLELSKDTSAPSAGILISPEQAKKAGIKGQSEEEAAEEKKESGDDTGEADEDADEDESGDEKSIIKKIIDFLKDELISKAGKWVKGLAVDFIAGAVGGGISTFVKTMGKVFGGVKFVASIIGKATDKFISKVENPKDEMAELEAGEDDPTDAATKTEPAAEEANEALIRRYVRTMLNEKKLRGEGKKKRVLYHIAMAGPKPPRPIPKMKWIEEWDAQAADKKTGEKTGEFIRTAPDNSWQRYWLDQPIESGIFLSPNWKAISSFHGRIGHVYAFKVPEWVIKKAGGIHRYDHGSEILISEEIWNEAGDEIEFLGKSVDVDDVFDAYEHSYSDTAATVNRRGTPRSPSWLDAEELAAWEAKQKEFNLIGLRATKHPKDVIKLLKPDEVKAAMAAFEKKYPEALTGEKHKVEWEKSGTGGKGSRKSIWSVEPPISAKDQELMDLLQKRMAESLIRDLIRENLPPWMIDAIQKREEQEGRRKEAGRRLPLYKQPPPEMPEEEIEDPEEWSDIVDYSLKETLHQYIRLLLEAQYAGPGVQQQTGYGKNYHTVNPQPITWQNYEGLSYTISAEGDGSYYASIEVLDYPELSTPSRSFPDEGSAEWWVRDNYEKLHRFLLAQDSPK